MMRPQCSHSSSTTAWAFERPRASVPQSSSSEPQTETPVRQAGRAGAISQGDPPTGQGVLSSSGSPCSHTQGQEGLLGGIWSVQMPRLKRVGVWEVIQPLMGRGEWTALHTQISHLRTDQPNASLWPGLRKG